MIDLIVTKRRLDEALTAALNPEGFCRISSLSFRREGDVEQFLLFGARKDARGFIAVTASVAMKFCIVSELLEGSETDGIHLNVPVHMLSAERRFTEWQVHSIDQIPATVAAILSGLKVNAFPFFDSFGTPEAMRNRLRSDSAREWFALSPEQRLELLVALEATLGNGKGAMMLLDVALEHLQGALPGKRFRLEKLRAKLIA